MFMIHFNVPYNKTLTPTYKTNSTLAQRHVKTILHVISSAESSKRNLSILFPQTTSSEKSTGNPLCVKMIVFNSLHLF